MENYKFVARDEGGNRKEGVRRASNHLEVLAWVRQRGMTPVSVNRFSEAKMVKQESVMRKRIKSLDLASFCWQLTTMVEGGVPITGAIETICEDTENATLRNTLEGISERMHRGETLSDAVSQYPSVFNQMFCAMIAAGEAGGSLPQSLHRLAEYYETRDKLIRKVRGAMTYPIFVLFFITFIVVAIMTFIIPRFRMIFKQIGNTLPAFTQMYMNVYDFIVGNLLYIFLGLAVFIVVSVLYSRTDPGRMMLSKLVLRVPFMGRIISQAFVSTFCRTLSTLLAAGVPVLEALSILATMTKNTVIRNAVYRTRDYIVSGSSISLSMAASGFFPNLTIKMTQVGEESGSLPTVLDKTSDYYERRIDSLITQLIGFIEPAMIILVGAIVLVTVLALYLPIFSMSDIRK